MTTADEREAERQRVGHEWLAHIRAQLAGEAPVVRSEATKQAGSTSGAADRYSESEGVSERSNQ